MRRVFDISSTTAACLVHSTYTLSPSQRFLQEEQKEHLKLLLPLFREHLPQKLAELAFDRVPTTLPPQYLRNAMACSLACRVVYTEGEIHEKKKVVRRFDRIVSADFVLVIW